ncbi:hypothetical protein FOCC_FOCC016021 [Frankliniella occidentalis]|nr:hypothetical protein FOCC_FOCC016021 [Frankliniella occidentalis]
MRLARMGKALHTLAIIVATAVAFSGAAHLAVKDEDPFALPEHFLIGAGVSAIQTEGAWDADGKRESSLDHVLHTGKLTSQGFPADPHLHDVVADSYHRYKDDVKMAKASSFIGQIGLTMLLLHTSPNSTRPEDVYAAELFNQVHAGQMLGPIVLGDYPQVLKDELSDKLTEFTVEEKQLIKGSTDFIGFNIYFSMVAAWKDPSTSAPIMMPLVQKFVEDLPMTYMNIAGGVDTNPEKMWDRIDPDSIRDAVVWAWNSYKKPIVITENGIGDFSNMGKKDHHRSTYHSAFMRTLLTTMKKFKVDVIAYCAWSLIDSYEWGADYGRYFGLVHVDYEGKTLDRSLKDSSQFWIEIAEKRVVPLVEDPITTTPGPPASSTPSTSFASSTPSTSFASSTPSTSSASSTSTFHLLLIGAVLIALKSFHYDVPY